MTRLTEPAKGATLDSPGRLFMTADWTNVVLINYRVPASLLAPYVPEGCQLDAPPNEPDLNILSVVAMNFGRTRVFRLPVPGGRSFDEVNLRFYVRQGDRHGVVFLRQFVPNWSLVIGARASYNQPYYRARVSHDVRTTGEQIAVESRLRYRNHDGGLHLTARNQPETPAESSLAHFYKERYWGFHRNLRGDVYRFRVYRPVWRTFPIEDYQVTFDPGQILGGPWRPIDWNAALHSVVFAEGSSVSVFEAETMKPDEQ